MGWSEELYLYIVNKKTPSSEGVFYYVSTTHLGLFLAVEIFEVLRSGITPKE